MRRARNPLTGERLALPKPLVEIGGRPILWHVLKIYLAHGFRRFVLLTGYRGEQIEAFVADESWPGDAEIRCLDTGVDTPTGGRLHQAVPSARRRPFCLTYADGVADIDLAALLARSTPAHGAGATMTVVQPAAALRRRPTSTATSVTGFTEKPRSEQWINGGFFCFEPAVLDVLEPPTACSSASRSSAWPPTGSCGRSATRASGSAWTPTRTRSRSTTSGPTDARPVEAVGMTGLRVLVHRRRRPARRRGSSRPCSTAADRVVVIRPRRAGRLGAGQLGLEGSVDVVHGDICDRGPGDAGARPSTRSTACSTSPPRRWWAPPTARRAATFETNIRGTWTGARGVPRCTACAADRGRLLGQGLRPPADLPYREDHAAARRASPTTSRRPPRTCIARSLLAHVRAAGGGDALREPLRRRRPQPRRG